MSLELPGEFPLYQSKQERQRLHQGLKTGDVIGLVIPSEVNPWDSKYADVPLWERNIWINGCVSNNGENGQITIWIPFQNEGEAKIRLITTHMDLVQLIIVHPAEKYIPRASKQRLQYLSETFVKYRGGLHCVYVDSYFREIASGITTDGKRVTDIASRFIPEQFYNQLSS